MLIHLLNHPVSTIDRTIDSTIVLAKKDSTTCYAQSKRVIQFAPIDCTRSSTNDLLNPKTLPSHHDDSSFRKTSTVFALSLSQKGLRHTMVNCNMSGMKIGICHRHLGKSIWCSKLASCRTNNIMKFVKHDLPTDRESSRVATCPQELAFRQQQA